MDKRQFNEIHKMCREEWELLAISGAGSKTSKLYDFHNVCPACHLAALASMEPNKDFSQNCSLCPVNEWRAEAIMKNITVGAVCENGDNAFGMWRAFGNYVSTRKGAALVISKMKWTFLPEYRELEVGSLLVRARASIAKWKVLNVLNDQ
jgi:hypothetical protein